MKKLSAIFFFFLLFGTLLTQEVHCQWYNWQYGIEKIHDLSEDQVNSARASSNLEMERGRKTLIYGLGGVATSFALYGIAVVLDKKGKGIEYYAETMILVLSGLGVLASVYGGGILMYAQKQKSDLEKAFGKTVSQISLTPIIGRSIGKNVFGAQITLSLSQH